jgi:hypothetical protein
MIKFILLCFALCFPPSVIASTFIGNGGSPGDVELAVARKHVERTFREFSDYDRSGPSLCSCKPEFKDRPVCRVLETLTVEQATFCARVLYDKAGELQELMGQYSTVEFRWTRDSIEVRENNQLRAVDAVAERLKSSDPVTEMTGSSATGRLTLNVDRFLQMKTYERVFLLTHESFHLILWEGKPLVDEGPIGPFTGDEGGRTLLNSIAAAAVMEFYGSKIDRQFASSLSRSQAQKNFWLDLHYEALSSGQQNKTQFGMGDSNPVQFQARGYFLAGNWGSIGAVGSLRQTEKTQTVLGSVELKEKIQWFGLGLTARVQPFEDPTTFWGQSHFVGNLKYELAKAAVSLKDPNVGTNEEADTSGVRAEVYYMMPFQWNLWVFLGVSYQTHQYQYRNINLKYDRNQVSSFIGVSYGF